MRKILNVVIAGIFICKVSFAGKFDYLPEEMQIVVDIPTAELLNFNESAEVLNLVCALTTSKDPICENVKKINEVVKFEIVRRMAIEESINLLNKKRSESTEKQVRDAEEFIFGYGTKKERNRVAF